MKEQYIETSISDLFLSLATKWRRFIVLVLVFAILFTCIGLISAKQLSNSASSSELKAIESSLTTEELTNLKDAIELINKYKVMYTSQVEYNENSILQNLNSFAINKIRLEYYVNNHYQVTYPVIEGSNNIVPLVQAYRACINEKKIYELMSDKIDSSIKPEYYAEVVKVDDTLLDTDGVFAVDIMASDTQMLEKMAAIVEEYLENKYASVSEIYGEHELSLIDKSATVGIDNEVALKQQENYAQITTLKNSINDIEKQFSGDQLTYLMGSVHEKIEKNVNVLRYSIIGIIVGLFIEFAYEIITYLFSGNFKTLNDFRSYDLDVLGQINNKKYSTNFDKWLAKKRGRYIQNEDNIKFISTKLNAIADQGINSVCFAVSPLIKDLPAELNGILESMEISSKLVENILENEEALQTMINSDAVIFVEQLDVSKNSVFFEEYSLAKKLNVNPLGVLVVS